MIKTIIIVLVFGTSTIFAHAKVVRESQQILRRTQSTGVADVADNAHILEKFRTEPLQVFSQGALDFAFTSCPASQHTPTHDPYLHKLNNDANKIRFNCGAYMGSGTPIDVQAYNVPAFKISVMSTSSIDPTLTLPATPTSDIFITTQLSGCTFAYVKNTVDGSAKVVHIQPESSGVQEATTMAQKAKELLGDGAVVFQSGVNYKDRAYVSGVHKTDGWHFYSSYLDLNSKKQAAEL